MQQIQEIITFVASGNLEKLEGVESAEKVHFPDSKIDIRSIPIELQELNETEVLQLLYLVADYLPSTDFSALEELLRRVKTIRPEPEDLEIYLHAMFRMAVMRYRLAARQPEKVGVNCLFISIESGIMGNGLVSYVLLQTLQGKSVMVSSAAIPLASWAIEEVRARDNRITIGNVVYKRYPELRSKGWYAYAKSIIENDENLIAEGITRVQQISEAVQQGLIRLEKL
jgi:hypothetical protein